MLGRAALIDQSLSILQHSLKDEISMLSVMNFAIERVAHIFTIAFFAITGNDIRSAVSIPALISRDLIRS